MTFLLSYKQDQINLRVYGFSFFASSSGFNVRTFLCLERCSCGYGVLLVVPDPQGVPPWICLNTSSSAILFLSSYLFVVPKFCFSEGTHWGWTEGSVCGTPDPSDLFWGSFVLGIIVSGVRFQYCSFPVTHFSCGARSQQQLGLPFEAWWDPTAPGGLASEPSGQQLLNSLSVSRHSWRGGGLCFDAAWKPTSIHNGISSMIYLSSVKISPVQALLLGKCSFLKKKKNSLHN